MYYQLWFLISAYSEDDVGLDFRKDLKPIKEYNKSTVNQNPHSKIIHFRCNNFFQRKITVFSRYVLFQPKRLESLGQNYYKSFELGFNSEFDVSSADSD